MAAERAEHREGLKPAPGQAQAQEASKFGGKLATKSVMEPPP
jgi:hypothetical protein